MTNFEFFEDFLLPVTGFRWPQRSRMVTGSCANAKDRAIFLGWFPM